MAEKIFFADARARRLQADATLPAKFQRMLDMAELAHTVNGKRVCIKMHVGGNLGYTTIHPFFVRLLVDKVRDAGAADVFVADCRTEGCERRGYTSQTIGCDIIDLFREDRPELTNFPIGFRHLDEALISTDVLEADVMLVFSHFKGHGACGFGGACKNIAMGLTPPETRGKMHSLEGGIEWDGTRCTRCGKCVQECPNDANKFNEHGEYEIFFHNCTYCQHCIMVCPEEALTLTERTFEDFQEGMARVVSSVLDHFDRDNLFFINVLLNITIYCDCWGMSTPALVPDVGITAGRDAAVIDRASLDLIEAEKLLENGLPDNRELAKGDHLFEQIHGKDPYLITRLLGAQDNACYEWVNVE
jgi:uncharacterized Fe-S center protein